MKFKLLHFEINKILLLSMLGILLMCSAASANAPVTSGSFVTTLNKDFAHVLGIKNGTKLVQELRGDKIIIRRL